MKYFQVLLVVCALISFSVCRDVPVPGALLETTVEQTNQWAVRLAPGADASVVAARLGFHHARDVSSLGFHVFEVPQFRMDHPIAHKVIDGLLSAEEAVVWYQRQSLRQMFKRDVVLPPSDPYYENQWNLHGNNYADINVEPAWEIATGDGVTVSIVDDGLDYTNNDIADKYIASASYDINYNDSDPKPSSWDSHGTETAGTCCAIADNDFCGAGVAPEASVAAVRLIAKTTSDADEAAGLTYGMTEVDIYSNSWGPYDDGKRLEAPGPLTEAAIEEAITYGRDGRGAIYVWAGGNGLANGDNCNYDGYANSRFTIAVSAINYIGMQTYYSEPCAAHIISTPSSDSSGHGITATSQNQQCVTNFGGTSASCPMVAGVVAMMLETRPDLTWRDVQAILLTSAKQNDPNDSDWVMNGAGLPVNHKYGYGLLDAGASVAKCLSWALLGPYETYESGQIISGAYIPDRGYGSILEYHTVSSSFFVEHVEVTFDARHQIRGQVIVKLTSPSGTVSELAELHSDTSHDYTAWTFRSMRCWGEVPTGDWTLEVLDGQSGTMGQLNWWSLQLYGHYGHLEN